MSQVIDVKFKGLFNNPNPLSEIPDGALEIASNVVIDRPSIVESRRGVARYADQLDLTGGNVDRVLSFKDTLMLHYGNKMAKDVSGTWTDFTSTFANLSGFKLDTFQSNGNLFWTSNTGIWKLEDPSLEPRRAGVPKALGGKLSLDGSSGFLTATKFIAYRILWGYRGANENLVLGAPSQRLIIENDAAGSRNVELEFQIPPGINDSYFYQIYRSAEFDSVPNDELQLVVEDNPTTAQVSAGVVTVIDNRPNSLRGVSLYTNPSQEGILRANDRPPIAACTAVFEDHAFYGNTKTQQRFFLDLIAVGGDALKYVSETGNTTNASAVVTSIGDTSALRVGMRAVGAGIPANTTIATIDSATQVTLSANATATDTGVAIEFQDRITINSVNYWAGSSKNVSTDQFLLVTSGTPAENIEDTSKNFIELFNESTTDTTLGAYYLSGFEDLPGQMLIEEFSNGGTSFALTSTYGSSFEPILPSSGTSQSSSNETKENRVYYSKFGIPEAVPILNFFDVGRGAIKKLVPLRSALFVLSEGGVFRITGTPDNFSVSTLDNTISIRAGETCVPLNNKIFCVSNQGCISVSDVGVEVISLPIEKTIRELSALSNFNTLSFAVSYESERKYVLFSPNTSTSTVPDVAFVYNFYTQTWTTWDLQKTAGFVNPFDDKLYLANSDGYLWQERKTFTIEDYRDQAIDVTISSSSGAEITLADASAVTVGHSISQGNKRALILSKSGDVLTVDRLFSWAADSAEVSKPIKTEIKTLAIDGNNPGALKQFTHLDTFFLDSSFNQIELGFESNLSPYVETSNLTSTGIGAWGILPWGSFAWGGSDGGENTLPTLVPRNKSKAHWIKLSLSLEQAFKNFQCTGYSLATRPITLRGQRN